MHNIKRKVLERFLEETESPNEIDIFLYIAQFQNDGGCIHNLYYKDVCENLNISKQTFYNSLYRLEEKGLIILSGPHGYFNIRIVDNYIFNDDHAREGYLSLQGTFFFEREFLELSLRQKKLVIKVTMNLMNGIVDTETRQKTIPQIGMDKLRTYSRGIHEEEVLDAFGKMSKYLNVIKNKDLFFIELKDFKTPTKEDTGLHKFITHNVIGMCRRYKIEYDEKSVFDIYYLFKSQFTKYAAIIHNLINTAFDKKSLQPALVNYMINLKS